MYDICFLQYVPAPQEYVVGIVTGRVGEGWRVDIGSAHQASLDGYAFEGATKRNKPNLKVLATHFSPLVVLTNLLITGQLSDIRKSFIST